MSKRKTFVSAILSIVSLLGLSVFTSCEESFSTDPGMRLTFSVDTLSFDTVFSTIKSPTKRLMVKNMNKKALRIDQVTLAGGDASCFMVNVDGETGSVIRNVEISARDSAYVFVSVNVDELGQDAPLRIEDRLTFHFNGTSQQVILETYGQDVEIWKGRTIWNDTVLTANKPYIIYDSLAIVAGKELTLNAGCRIYFHNNANLFVYGNLKAEGTAEQPVIMRGDRFDDMNFLPPVPYNDVAGQWGGVYLYGAGEHSMKHVNINSGYVGVFLSYNGKSPIPSPDEMPKLTMQNCMLHNFLIYGLVAQNADLMVTNSIISNTGSYSVYTNGGTHTFIHTTVANYFNSGKSSVQPKSRDPKEPAVMIMNLNKTAPMRTTFLNCAISGNVANEFSLASRVPNDYDGTFRHTYIKRDSIAMPQFAAEDSIRWYKEGDVLFKSTELDLNTGQTYNFEPDSASVLLRLADPDITRQYGLQYDLNGMDRYATDRPAAGACEWQPEENTEEP